MNINYIGKRLHDVTLKDILHIFIFLIALLPSYFIRLYKGKFWLICEEKDEARDNGYVFFLFMKQNHPEIPCYYAINKNSVDYNKVKKFKSSIIQFGSLKHWIYYLAADINISSQKGGKPNAAVCYLLEVSGLLKNKRVFLQHGVMLNNAKFLHYENTKIRLFIAGALPEYHYLCDEFGYPKGWVKYCGMCRFDLLHHNKPNQQRILLMPSWRNWLIMPSKAEEDAGREKENVSCSDYIKRYQELITDKRLIEYLKKNKLEMMFYPHRNAQRFLNLFSVEYPVIICAQEKYDIQDLLKECSLMITDYSSVSIDFAYMKKPIIYYQFDSEKFRKLQYEKSYFNYETCGFGKVTSDLDTTVNEIINYIENQYQIDDNFKKAHSEFFELYDENNCERSYNAICEI